jgi:hypothetical protein
MPTLQCRGHTKEAKEDSLDENPRRLEKRRSQPINNNGRLDICIKQGYPLAKRIAKTKREEDTL